MRNNRQISFLFVLLSLYLILLVLNQLQILNYLILLFKKLDFIILSIIIALLFEPIISSIPLKKRGVKCSIVYLGLLLLIGLFIVLVIPVLITQINLFVNRYPSWFNSNVFSSIVNSIVAQDWGRNVVSAVSSATTLFSQITDFFLLYLASYFISLDLETIMRYIKRRIKRIDTFEHFFSTCSSAVYHYIQGLCLDLLVLFIAEVSLLWLFRFAYPITFAFVTVMLNLIPYIGAMLAQILILLVDFNQFGYFRFELFIFGFVLQQIEANFVQPYIFSKVLKLKPIVTLISILVFGYFFKFTGLILAPIFAVVIQLAYRSLVYANDKKTVGTWKNVWYNFEEIGEEDK